MVKSKFNFAQLFRGKIENLKIVFAEEEVVGASTTKENTIDTGTTASATSTHSTINYEDLIARARKEEKDKLYPVIEDLKGKNKTLVEKNNQLLIRIGEKDSELEVAKNSKDSTSFEAEKKTLLEKIAQLEADLKGVVPVEDLEKQIRGEISSEYELKDYRSQAIYKALSANEGIIEELIQGKTKEEIDASVEVSKKRFKDIAGKTASTTNFKPINPQNNSKDFSNIRPEDIKTMSMKEYAEYRKSLGLSK